MSSARSSPSPALPSPRRVVSLLPSATEIVGLLGAADRLVGKSHECDHPSDLGHAEVLTAQKTSFDTAAPDAARRVDRQVREALEGGDPASLYHLDTDRLRRLQPDLIITQDLCSVCSIDLATVHRAVQEIARDTENAPRVLSLNPQTLESVFDDILAVGEALGSIDRARDELVRLRARFCAASDHVTAFGARETVLFLEWTDPVFCGGHWTPQLIERAGADHPLNPTEPIPGSGEGIGPQQASRRAGKSTEVPIETILKIEASGPEGRGGWDRVIVCPCGLDLNQARGETVRLLGSDWFAGLKAVQEGRLAMVDGNQMFNRPGPRLIDAYEWLVGWLHDRPELIPNDFPWQAGLPADGVGSEAR